MTTTPTTWRAPFTANASNTAGSQFNPYTIGLSNGNILVVWTDDTSGSSAGNDVFGQIYGPEGDTVGAAFQVNSSFFADGEFLGSIAPQTDGGFVIAYVDDEGAGVDAIRIERKDAAGASTFVGSITGAAGTISDPEITVAPNGSYMITFTRNIGGDIDVRAVVVSSSNVVGAEFDAAQNSSDIDSDSDTAGLSNNTFVTVYEEADAGVTGIEAKIVDSTGTFVANPQVANTGTDPHVAALTGGGFAVVWNDPANGGDIRFSVFNNAGTLIANQVLVAGGANAQNEPKVVRLLDGGFFVVWDDDTTGNLTGQRFNSAGAAVGGNVIIDTSFGIIEPELGLTSDGRILVTYSNAAGEISEAILDPRDNVITGTGASEVLTTQIGNTTIFGGSGLDTIFGQGGNDVIQGGFSTDSIFAGAGNDTIQVLEGEFIDHVDGESGTDTLDLSNISSLPANINLDTGIWDLSPSFGGPASISSIEVVIGTQGNDTITTNFGTQTLNGGLGDDSFVMLEGRFIDEIAGGSGTDTLDLSDITSRGAIVDLASGTWDLSPSFGGPQNISSVEAVLGTQVDDVLTGGFASELLSGNDGDDVLTGGSGNDTIRGGDGNDLIQGGFATDSIFGGEGNDTVAVLEGEFIDHVDGREGRDVLDLRTITSRGAVIDLSAGTWDLSPSFGGPAAIASVEEILGTALGDTITGIGANEVFTGREGADVLSGAGGEDTLIGGDGNDALDGGDEADILDGGEGADTLDGGTGSDNLDGGVGSDTLLGRGGNDILLGREGQDVLNGGGGNDEILGAEGNDNVNGGDGNDIIAGGEGDDVLNGGDGVDMVRYTSADSGVTVDLSLTGLQNTGGAGIDRVLDTENITGSSFDDDLFGTGGANVMFGGDGDDSLSGRAGDDAITGGAGADVLAGGGDNDLFDYDTVADSTVGVAGRDLILNFATVGASGDLIDVSDIDARAGLGGDQAFTFIGAAAFFAEGQIRAVTNAAGHTILQFNTTGAGGAEMAIEFNAVVGVGAGNFIL